MKTLFGAPEVYAVTKNKWEHCSIFQVRVRNLFKGRKSLNSENNIGRECSRIQHAEDTSKKLLKESKKLSDTSLVVGKNGSKMGTDLGSLAAENGDKFMCGNIFENTMEDCDKAAQDRNVLIQKTLVEPMRKYTTIFPQLNAHIKSHEKVQQDYKKLQGKVDKLREKEETGPNIVKMQNLKKELGPVKEEFESKHNMLLDEFPAFYNSRLQYLQPIFESLIMTQCWYHNELQEVFDDCLTEFSQCEPQRTYDSEEVQATMEQIRALSITKD